MAGWGTFFGSIAGPVVKKALTAIGIGTVTMIGMQTGVEAAFNALRTSLSAISGNIAVLVAQTGFFDAISIIAGGIMAAVSLMTLKKLSILT